MSLGPIIAGVGLLLMTRIGAVEQLLGRRAARR